MEIDGFLNHMARFARDRRRARMLATECEWTIAPYAVEEVAKDLESTLKANSDTLSVACPNSSSKFGEGLDSLGA